MTDVAPAPGRVIDGLDMRITKMTVTPVAVPFLQPEVWTYGSRRGIANILVELETESGLTGIGEAVGWPSPEVALDVLAAIEAIVVGADGWDIERLVHQFYMRNGWHYFRHTASCAFAGVEMALWDLTTRAAGIPLHVAFGGVLSREVPYYWFVPAGETSDMVAFAVEGVRRGFRTIYLKVGFTGGGSLEAVDAIRRALGDAIRIRVDANESWTASEAHGFVRSISRLGVEFIEQPVNMYDLAALGEVSGRSMAPVAANQTSWSEFSALEVIIQGLASIVVTDPHQVGGLLKFKKVAYMAELADLPIVKHSFGDLGVTSMATAHVLATCRNAGIYAHQTHYNLLAEDVIVGGPPEFASGALTVPDTPGIGVDLDRGAVAVAAERFQQGERYSPYEERV